MRAGTIIRIVGVFLGLLAAARTGQAQTAGPATNVSAVARGGVVIVSYDLIASNPAAEFSIVLEASLDGGKTYSLHPKSVKGDVGPAVRAGIGKQITWAASQDVENLEIDRYRYRVIAKPAPVRAAAPTPPSGGAAQGPSQQAPQKPTVQAGSGNGRRWGGLALLGVGGTLAALGATAMKEEHCESPCTEVTNKKLVWAGVAAAAGGVALLAFGGHNNDTGTHIMIHPRGVMVRHRLTFKGIGRAEKP